MRQGMSCRPSRAGDNSDGASRTSLSRSNRCTVWTALSLLSPRSRADDRRDVSTRKCVPLRRQGAFDGDIWTRGKETHCAAWVGRQDSGEICDIPKGVDCYRCCDINKRPDMPLCSQLRPSTHLHHPLSLSSFIAADASLTMLSDGTTTRLAPQLLDLSSYFTSPLLHHISSTRIPPHLLSLPIHITSTPLAKHTTDPSPIIPLLTS
ncbi:hypothetical protein BKA70DRAFT_690738 [Coprinopsis sp. MPI-PUGE-AT-0042]|nr:hypothetical protein BKA70DRAFT_690738 [Coprinopsis sp. MPI-PUGE-AT-0042]